jgi:predicted dehydrogenase
MGAVRLRAGVLGLGGSGQTHLKALTQIGAFELVAVADKDKTTAARLADEYHCPAFDDYRQFIIQNSFDCLIVCEGLHACLEHVRMALKKKFHVLKSAPMARGFAEAAELADLAAAERVCLDVADPLGYCGRFSSVRKRLSDKSLDRPFLIRAFWETGLSPCHATGRRSEGQAAWMTDRQLAGGGVLLHDGYGLIHTLVTSLGLPQQVYCLSRSHASDKAPRYLAEDVAVLGLRFGEGLFADLVLIRHWDNRPGCRQVTVYAKDGVVAAECCAPPTGDAGLEAHDPEPQTCEDEALTTRLLTDYAASLVSQEDRPFGGDAETNLQVMAVIEAAYISAQTGSPESPSRILARRERRA